jgi:hypothetical protein
MVSRCTITGDETYPVLDDVHPKVLRTFPRQGWTQVPTTVDIKIWFSEPIEPATANVATIGLSTGEHFQRCRYKVHNLLQDQCLVEMIPVEELIGGVEYQLEISQAVSDLNGNGLSSSVVVRFTTMGH